MNELNLSFNIDSVENEQVGVRKRERIKEGISSYRILPPFGTSHGGALSHKYFVHWGFVGANGKERTVACSYPTEGYCPVCTQVYEAMDELKRAEGNKDEKAVAELNEYIGKYRVKKFWLYNAVSADGRVVILELGKTAHDALSKRISEAVRRKVGAYDPTSPESGVWFEFTRTGKGLNTEYSVDFKKTSVTLDDGNVADKPDRTPLPSELVQNIKKALMGESPGLLHDIHVAHDPMTSTELRALMGGGIVQSKKPSLPTPRTEAAAPAAVAPASQDNVQAEIARLRALQSQSA